MDNQTNQLKNNDMEEAKKHFGFQADSKLAAVIQTEAKNNKRSVSSFIRAILEMVLLPEPEDAEVAE
jgi:hypothetical protein